jgi:hypothetical protein
MTGFRLAAGGVQELLNVNADIVCFGKVIVEVYQLVHLQLVLKS